MAITLAHTPDRPTDGDLFDALKAGIAVALPALAATGAGRLVSLSLTISPDHLDTLEVVGAECLWLAPGLTLHASGEAIRIDGDLGRRFQKIRADWLVLGDSAARPIGFFTFPPPNSPDLPTLWVPQVVIRRDGDTATVTFSMRHDGETVAEVTRRWTAVLRSMLTAPPTQRGDGGDICSITACPDARQWAGRVEATTRAIADGRFDKVVLARRFDILMTRPPVVADLVRRLAAINPQCRSFALPYRRGSTVASTPEILATKRGRLVVAHALAGTAKRHDSETDSQAAAARLLASPKERHEHEVVVATIAAQLRSLCETVRCPPRPEVMALRFVQHLWTPISGTLPPDLGLLDVVAQLHPTPAVLGAPRAAAARWLDQVGERRDGLYSGVAGWIDADGDGDAAVVLRSAHIEGCGAVLWAGAGIVADSLPEAELAETEMKMATMLEVLRPL